MYKKGVIFLVFSLILLSGCTQTDNLLSSKFEECDSIKEVTAHNNCKEKILETFNLNERNICKLSTVIGNNLICQSLFYSKVAIETNDLTFCEFIRTDNPTLPKVEEAIKIKENCLKKDSSSLKRFEEIKKEIMIEANSLTEWEKTLPIYYSNIAETYYYSTKTALDSNDMELCEKNLDIEKTKESRDATSNCQFIMFTKMDAFTNKDLSKCRDLYAEDTTIYEECNAPLITYSAIKAKDKTLCKKQLTIQRLINLCEEDYEKLKE